MTWADHAACKSMPLAMFFPQPGERPVLALETCRRCPVRVDCYGAAVAEEVGLTTSEITGIRGGYTASDRIRHRRSIQNRRDAHAAIHGGLVAC